MKWRRLLKPLLVVLLVWWWTLLIQSPPSQGLWRDVRCDIVNKMPANCTAAYRLYPEPSAWLWEFFVEPLGGATQDW